MAYDTNNTRTASIAPIAAAADGGLGLLLAGLPLRKKKKEMQTVNYKADASDYILSNSFRLNYRNDSFINKTMSRVPIPKATSSSPRGGPGMGGGSSVHFSSSGHMHGGGGRGF